MSTTPTENNRTTKALTAKQMLFALEYLKDLNATQAAIRAGYSSRTAAPAASRLLRNVKVSAEIRRAMDERAKRLELTADRVLQEISKLAFSNIFDFLNIDKEGVGRVDLNKVARDHQPALKKYAVEEFTEGKGDEARPVRRTRIEMADKCASLELLGRHLKLFTDKHEPELADVAKLYAEFQATFQLHRLSDEELEQLQSEIARSRQKLLPQ